MKFQLARCDVYVTLVWLINKLSKHYYFLIQVFSVDPENSEREDRVPLPPSRMKTSIITTLKGGLEGWESYKHVLKIQEKKGAAAPPLNPPMGSSLVFKNS